MTNFETRLDAVRQRVEGAGGSLDRITLVAVTKTRPASAVEDAIQNGILDIGENYAQELISKSGDLKDDPGAAVRWHMIGQVQRNKVAGLAPLVSLWQTVDRAKLGSEIAKRAPGADVLVQVNTTGEASKGGCEPNQVGQLVEHLEQQGLGVRGLMTVGPTDRGVDPRQSFEKLRLLAETFGLKELSMGMSGDLEAAVSEGSTMIRVGAALFGPRDLAN